MRTCHPDEILHGLRPGQRVYFQGGPGESELFYNVLRDNPERLNGVELWSCLIPGINTRDYGALPGNVTLTTFMASPALEGSIASGRTILKAMPYSEIAETMAATAFDVAVLHTAPPDSAGRLSFGISCDMAGLVWPKARRRIALVNQHMPSLPHGEFIPQDEIEFSVPAHAPLLAAGASPGRSTGVLAEIARRAAALVPDGATIQSGIGEAPAAVVAALRLHRGLKVYSGIITPEYRALMESGAIDPRAENITGVAWGDAAFYAWLAQSGFAFRSARVTHGADELAKIERFVSIGSAIEVDLAGNLNLEWLKGRRVSSVGGAPDYLRAASGSRDGMSIIALPATAGRTSRIVPHLASPSIPGELVEAVVTEYGVARLKGLSPEARAAALVAVAEPEHRDLLLRK